MNGQITDVHIYGWLLSTLRAHALHRRPPPGEDGAGLGTSLVNFANFDEPSPDASAGDGISVGDEPLPRQYILLVFASSLDQPRPLDTEFPDAPGVIETHHATIAPAGVIVPHSSDVENDFPSTEEDP